jgi:uncharacterized membrane protein YvbJ
MYCPTCGNRVVEGLIFCNQCGARVSESEKDAGMISEASFNILVGGLITIPIVGLGIIIALLIVMKKDLGFDNPMILIITFMSFALLLIAEGGLFWLLMHMTKARKTTKSTKTNKKDTAQLNEVVIKGLNEGRHQGIYEPVPSVTDSTTRNLEPVYRDPKTNKV